MDIELTANMELIIDVFNINGQKLNQQKVNLGKGSHVLTLNSADLPGGVYLLSIISRDRKIIETRKFIK
ncbi:MAG: T9SS type A sorting domain-containing protein [Bacteroidales bacterium]